jgi:modification methylase
MTIFKEEFMEATTDVWDIQPESANRVGHPAPFPVELPERLIQLYTYEGDLVLDPFIGSGSSAVAAVRTDRHFVGYDLDEAYRQIALRRVADEQERLSRLDEYQRRKTVLPAIPQPALENEDFQRRAVVEGRKARELARWLLEASGFSITNEDQTFAGGVEVNYVAKDMAGRRWFFDVSGAFTSPRAGLLRTDTLWKALGKAAVLATTEVDDYALVLLTTDLPTPGTRGAVALNAAIHGGVCLDAIGMLNADAPRRLREYALGGSRTRHTGSQLVEELGDDD